MMTCTSSRTPSTVPAGRTRTGWSRRWKRRTESAPWGACSFSGRPVHPRAEIRQGLRQRAGGAVAGRQAGPGLAARGGNGHAALPGPRQAGQRGALGWRPGRAGPADPDRRFRGQCAVWPGRGGLHPHVRGLRRAEPRAWQHLAGGRCRGVAAGGPGGRLWRCGGRAAGRYRHGVRDLPARGPPHPALEGDLVRGEGDLRPDRHPALGHHDAEAAAYSTTPARTPSAP